jgi:hypothetical protein
MRAIFVLLLVAGCASTPPKQYQWVSSTGADRAQHERDFGQCEAQALSVTGVSTERGFHIFAACMRGKGWTLVER